MTAKEFFATIKKKQFYRVYFLFGQQIFLINKGINDLKHAILGNCAFTTNFAEFELPQTDIKDAILLTRCAPMFGERRIILLKNVERATTSQTNSIISSLPNIPESTVLIMKSESKIKRDNAIIKALKGIPWAAIVDFTYVERQDIKKWAYNILHISNCTMSENALEMLMDTYQEDMNYIYNELNKLVTYAAGNIYLDVEHIKEMVPGAFSASIFELSDAVANNNVRQAILLLFSLLKAGISPNSIIGMITKHLKDIWITKCLTSKGKSPEEISKILKIAKKHINKYITQANLFSFKHLRLSFSYILDTDIKLKTTNIKADYILESLIFRLCKN